MLVATVGWMRWRSGHARSASRSRQAKPRRVRCGSRCHSRHFGACATRGIAAIVRRAAQRRRNATLQRGARLRDRAFFRRPPADAAGDQRTSSASSQRRPSRETPPDLGRRFFGGMTVPARRTPWIPVRGRDGRHHTQPTDSPPEVSLPIPDPRSPIPDQRCLIIASSSGAFTASLCLGSLPSVPAAEIPADTPRTSGRSSVRRCATAAGAACTAEWRSTWNRLRWITCSRSRVAARTRLATSWPRAGRAIDGKATFHRTSSSRATPPLA